MHTANKIIRLAYKFVRGNRLIICYFNSSIIGRL